MTFQITKTFKFKEYNTQNSTFPFIMIDEAETLFIYKISQA